MGLTIEEVESIARRIARERIPQLERVDVAASDPDADRVELLVTLRRCDREPCVVELNLTRADRDAFEREFEQELRVAQSKS